MYLSRSVKSYTFISCFIIGQLVSLHIEKEVVLLRAGKLIPFTVPLATFILLMKYFT